MNFRFFQFYNLFVSAADPNHPTASATADQVEATEGTTDSAHASTSDEPDGFKLTLATFKEYLTTHESAEVCLYSLII